MNQYEDITGPIVPRRIAREHPAYGLGGGMLLVIAGLVAMLVAFFVDTVMSWDLLRPDLPRETRLMLHGEVALAILAYVTGYCALARSALFPWLFSGLTAATLLLAGYSIAVVEMGLSTRSPGLFQVTACLLGILLPYVVLSRRVAVTYRRDVGDWRPPGAAPAARPANEVVAAVPEPAPVAAPGPAIAAAVPAEAPEWRPEPVAEPSFQAEPQAGPEARPAPRPAAQDIDFDIPPLAQPIIRRDKARDPFEALLKKPEEPARPSAERPAVPKADEPVELPPVAPSFDPVFDDAPAPAAARVEPPVRPTAAPSSAGGRYDPFGDDLFAAAATVSPMSDPFFADPAPAAPGAAGGAVPPPTFAATTQPPLTPAPVTPPPMTAAPAAAAPVAPPPPPRPKAKPASNFDWLSAPSPAPASAAPAAPVPAVQPPVAPPPPAGAPFGAQPFGVPPARPAPPPPPAEAAPVGEVAPRLYEQLSRLRRIAGTSGQ